MVADAALLHRLQGWNLTTAEDDVSVSGLQKKRNDKTPSVVRTAEQSRKQTGLLGDSAARAQAAEREPERPERTEGREGRAMRAEAVLSDPHSSRPSYISELLRDIIWLKR